MSLDQWFEDQSANQISDPDDPLCGMPGVVPMLLAAFASSVALTVFVCVLFR